MKFLRFVVIVLCTLTCRIAALECFSCEGKDGDLCVQKPESAQVITCNKNEKCYVMRFDSTKKFGDSVTVKRGCKVLGTVPVSNKNSDYVSSQICSNDRCNSGDGTRLDFGGFDFNGFDFSGFGYSANHFGKGNISGASGNTAVYTPLIVVIAAVINYIYMVPN